MFPLTSFHDRLSADLANDLVLFVPELILCGTIVLLLLARFVRPLAGRHLGVFVLAAAAVSLYFLAVSCPGMDETERIPRQGQTTIFSGLLTLDFFGLFVRGFLLVFLIGSVSLSLVTRIPDADDSAAYFTLLIGGTLGMMLMASANHLLMAFIAVEMASVPSYALAGFLKGKRQGSEASLKYVIYGASASGIMLYGISLLTCAYGTGSLTVMAQTLSSQTDSVTLPVVVGVICVLAGLCFKLSAVPFHFWCPDVFEGAAAEVGAFLSVASKAAALALTTRFLFVVGGGFEKGLDETLSDGVTVGWAVLAAVTATFGNLAALWQTNVKRMLAYSTIAHAGIMMMALLPGGSQTAGPLLYYISGYLVMNLGAFAIVALVRNGTGSESIEAYRGLMRRSPVLALGMSAFLLSLLGLPPLVGFAAKFQVFAALYEMGRGLGSLDGILAWAAFALLGIAAINTAISAGYYLRLVRTMTLDEPTEDRPLSTSAGSQVLVAILVGLVLALGLFWNPLAQLANSASRSFQRPSDQGRLAPLEKSR